MKVQRFCGSLLIVFAVLSAHAEPSDQWVAQLEAPRPFGIVIGDLIHHRIRVEVDRSARLKADSVPSVGSINYWLELRDREIERKEKQGKTDYSIHLTYQTFYAPREVETLTVPGFTLSFDAAGKTLTAQVQPWNFTMSVIRDLSVLSRDGQMYIRPDDPPDLLDIRGPLLRIAILVGALLVMIGAVAYFFGYLPFSRRGRIFHEALKRLQALAKNREETEPLKAVLFIVHGAFNSVYGRPLFYDGLEGFFAEHPGYRCVQQNIEEFFQASNALFFAGNQAQAIPYSIEQALSLCQICRTVERGMQ